MDFMFRQLASLHPLCTAELGVGTGHDSTRAVSGEMSGQLLLEKPLHWTFVGAGHTAAVDAMEVDVQSMDGVATVRAAEESRMAVEEVVTAQRRPSDPVGAEETLRRSEAAPLLVLGKSLLSGDDGAALLHIAAVGREQFHVPSGGVGGLDSGQVDGSATAGTSAVGGGDGGVDVSVQTVPTELVAALQEDGVADDFPADGAVVRLHVQVDDEGARVGTMEGL